VKKMYICPTCNKECETEEILVKHFLKCWKTEHPSHQSKPAPRSADINTREVDNDIMDFFNSFQQEEVCERH
jgi:hypothetical protein